MVLSMFNSMKIISNNPERTMRCFPWRMRFELVEDEDLKAADAGGNTPWELAAETWNSEMIRYSSRNKRLTTLMG